jgi:hypothetical protein
VHDLWFYGVGCKCEDEARKNSPENSLKTFANFFAQLLQESIRAA